MHTNPEHKDALQEDDSIDVIAYIAILWRSRKLIFITTLVFFIFGVLVALFSPVKYSASTVFVPQLGSEEKTLSGLSSLASLAGINLNSGVEGNDISPLLYPNLSSNISFRLELLTEQLTNSSNEQVDVQTYLLSQSGGINILALIKKYTIGLPGLLFSKDETSNSIETNLITLTEEQKELVEVLSEKYSVNINDKKGYLSVSAIDKDPVVAAELVRIVTSNLQDEIIQKRLEKVQNNLDFTENQYQQKKREFEQIQDRLARFKDRNQNISSSLFLNELERIQAEYSIALNVITELASQVESAKLQVNRDTPIFSVIDPVTVPTERDAPKRKLIVIIWLFFGFVIASVYALVKKPAIQIINKISQIN